MKAPKRRPIVPIGHTVKITIEIDALRGRCSRATQRLLNSKRVDEADVDECARLDEALARTSAILKSVVSSVMLARIKRRSRRSRAK